MDSTIDSYYSTLLFKGLRTPGAFGFVSNSFFSFSFLNKLILFLLSAMPYTPPLPLPPGGGYPRWGVVVVVVVSPYSSEDTPLHLLIFASSPLHYPLYILCHCMNTLLLRAPGPLGITVCVLSGHSGLSLKTHPAPLCYTDSSISLTLCSVDLGWALKQFSDLHVSLSVIYNLRRVTRILLKTVLLSFTESTRSVTLPLPGHPAWTPGRSCLTGALRA
jgi:hypothetical protein